MSEKVDPGTKAAILVDRVRRGMRVRQTFLRKAPLYWRFYRGNHWPDGMEDTHSAPVINYFFSAIETRVAHLAASRPRPVVKPRNPEDIERAELRSLLLDYWWDLGNISAQWADAIKEAEIIGVGILYVGWIGNRIDVRYVDPLHIVIDPMASSMDSARWVAQVDNLYVDQIREMLEDDSKALSKLEEIEGQGVMVPDSLIDVIYNSGNPSYGDVAFTNAGPYGVPAYPISSSRKDLVSEKRLTHILFWEKRKDGWWMVRMANGVILQEMQNPFAIGSHDDHPYVAFRPYRDGRTFWSPGLGHQIEGLQISIDLREQAILDILRLCASPIFLIPTESGLKHKLIKVQPGMKLPYNYPFKPEWLAASLQNIAPLFNTQEADIQRLQDIVGMVHILKGTTPPNVESGVAIDRLAGLANARIQLSATNLADDMKRMGRLMLARIEKFMDKAQMVRLVREGGEERFVELNTSYENQLGTGEFDISVEQGPSLPTERLEELQLRLALFQAGLVSDEAVLKKSGLEDWKKELEKRRQAQQDMAQYLQAQRGIGGAGGAVPAPPEEASF